MTVPTDLVLGYPGHELLLPPIVEAAGSHLIAADGSRYLDLEAGVWCASLGHNHPAVTEALTGQYAKLAHAGFNYTSPVVADAASAVLARLGFGGGACTFLCSGSEAVEYCVRAAQSIQPRPRLLTMVDSYCGAYGSAFRKHSDEWYCYDWMACADCDHDAGCEPCPHWQQIPWPEIGGFLLEPGSSSGLVRFPPHGLVRRLAAEVVARGGCLLVNEVTTGIGRTGRWFGFQHYDLQPDFVALGKGIGNGYPVSVAAMSPRARRLLGDQPLKYAQSHQNDPAGAAVVSAVLAAIEEEGLLARAVELGHRLVTGLATIGQGTGRVRQVRARGLMIAIELDDDAEFTLTAAVQRGLIRRGYLVGRRPGQPVLRLDPSLTVAAGDVDGFLEAMNAVLSSMSG